MIETTEYYDEFLRYFAMASDQQEKCNVSSNPPYGMLSHLESNVNDDLMHHVELYDVVERKYAGFSQIINDCFYGWTNKHPYWEKMKVGKVTRQREMVANDWTGKHSDFKLPEWLYIFILHRVTGSAINYSTKPSGYHNTILIHLYNYKTIEEMAKFIKNYNAPFYTSIGYQFPSFPKPTKDYKRGGDYYLCEYAPRLARDMAEWLESSAQKKDLREVGDFMFKWNNDNGMNAYKFQYAAVIADIADWFPQYVNKESMFYYGTNAVECISYLANPTSRMKKEDFLDRVMMKIYEDTGSIPYNAEDVCCDFIRYLENYIRPGDDYNHLNMDEIWNSSKFIHPYGRQRAMLELGLVKTFNGIKSHPSDDKIIKEANISPKEYVKMVKQIYLDGAVPNIFS